MKRLLLLALISGLLSVALPVQAQNASGTYGWGYPVQIEGDVDFGSATADGYPTYSGGFVGNLSASAAATALNTDNTLATVENSLNELENIDYLDLNELIQTTDIMNSLGWANDFFTQNSSLISQLQTLNPGLNLFNNPSGQGVDHGYDSGYLSGSTALGVVNGLLMRQISALGFGGTSSDLLAGIKGMTQAQADANPDAAANALSLAWNSKVIGNASIDATLIDDFEKSGQQLASAAQSQTTLEGQVAISNQVQLLQSHQQNAALRDQSQMNTTTALMNAAMLQIMMRQEKTAQANAALGK